MLKKEIRKKYLHLRSGMSKGVYLNLSARLLSQFKLLNLTAVNCIHLYIPITARKEPNTLPIRKWLKETHPHIKLVYPQTNFKDHSMRSYADDEHLVLEENFYGTTEPIAGTEVAATEIDLVILPLLAFDEHGNRVGYGKGFYDRFISDCKPDVSLVGLSFFDPVEKISDITPLDKKLTASITPYKTWVF